MQILNKNSEIYDLCTKWKAAGERVALVPTMGYYHAGHASLMQYARDNATKVVVSLFVNPMQFAPTEDLAAYPRDLEHDAAIAKSIGVDVIFAPNDDEMYTSDFSTVVSLPKLNKGLCSISRPTHFDGVATVVLKLFMLTQVHMAVFGQKDWQQLTIIRQMVRDLNIPITIEGCPIVREDDGLALSSRNVYLSAEERAQAPHIYKAICAAKHMAQLDVNTVDVLQMVQDYIAQNIPLGKIDYATIVDANTLEPQDSLSKTSLLACAVRIGKARLIDNMLLL